MAQHYTYPGIQIPEPNRDLVYETDGVRTHAGLNARSLADCRCTSRPPKNGLLHVS